MPADLRSREERGSIEHDITFPTDVVSNKAEDEVATLLLQLIVGAVAPESDRCSAH